MTHVEYYRCDNCTAESTKEEPMVMLFLPYEDKVKHFCDALCLKEWVMRELKTDDTDRTV
jgi:hypothetical protein